VTLGSGRGLVVAATAGELAGAEGGADTLCCGIGPVEAAVATALELERRRPAFVLQVGIAGSRSLEPPALVLGSESVYCDLGDLSPGLVGVSTAAPDPRLLAQARRLLPAARLVAIATSARLGGGAAFEVEAMEGFGVLRAAARAGVPALELRAVSNGYADPPAAWRVAEALAALEAAVRLLLEGLGA
jgi:futalosine hydrolase